MAVLWRQLQIVVIIIIIIIGQVPNSQLPVALRRETLAQYPCYVGSASE